jgi:MFS family permease
VGPVLALIYLYYYPDDYVNIFLLAFLPGMAGVLITFFLPPEHNPQPKPGKMAPFKGIFEFWKGSSPVYRRILAGGLMFALLNSTDMLLILRASDLGLSPGEVIGAYILYNLVYAGLSLPFGKWGDRFGFRNVYLISVLVFAISYLGMGLATEKWMVWAVFIFYGAFTSANDGSMKSWLSLNIDKEYRATGLGLAAFLETVFLAAASIIAGLVWKLSSGEVVFVGVGVAGLLVFLLLVFIFPRQPKKS